MSDWIQVKGLVKKGHRVASGKSGDPRFPQGTLEMQKPFFFDRGLNLNEYFSGTINLSIYPYTYEIGKAKYTFRNIQWSPEEPPEDFSFFECRVLLKTGIVVNGLIYYPHPETKPDHFQPPDILEIMTPFISDLNYGDELLLEVDSQQMSINL